MRHKHKQTGMIDESQFPYDMHGHEKPLHRSQHQLPPKIAFDQESRVSYSPVRRKMATPIYKFNRTRPSAQSRAQSRPQTAPAYAENLGGTFTEWDKRGRLKPKVKADRKMH